MKKVTRALTAVMLMTAIIFAARCTKDNDNNNSGDNPGGGSTNDTEVKVTTYTPQDITQTTAKCGGDVIAAQDLSLDELGVCWSTSSNPTAADSHLSTANWSETFVCTVTSLEPGTGYHVRAYALCGQEYYYGEDKTFTTLEGGGTNHEYVDLGLPSGTLWATCNVGATTPEGYGDYFAWGETESKVYYSWPAYNYCNGDYRQLTKYCSKSSYGYNGFTDHLTILEPDDDAATVNWGVDWRVPTKEEWQELLDNTTAIWTVQGGHNGRLFTATNGNCLFLPAACCHVGTIVYTGGYYWSSTLDLENPCDAWYLFSTSGSCSMYNYSRCDGLSVRPVRSARQN